MRSLLALALAPISWARGCDEACTDRGCIDRTELTLATPTPIPAGGLKVTVEADRTRERCTVTTETSTCTSQTLRPVVKEGALRAIELDVVPDTLSVQISSPTAVLLEEQVSLTYSGVKPTNAECDQGCLRGVATIAK